MIRNIPLDKLIASPRNVRQSSDPQADLELKADIEARGLLQNLVVTAVPKSRGRFAVEAGERRRRALQSLAQDGRIAKDHEVCCLVVGSSDARESSLAENFQRLAMNPADECLAFQALVEQGSDCEAIARRFGLTVRFVEGRLRLAGLAPMVFEALGAGAISLDVAKAYAATGDRDRQAHVFGQVEGTYMANHPDTIRRMMTNATIGAGDRLALFVGEEAYSAAGGRVERDLFSDEKDARWLDVPLAEQLALEKLEPLASQAAADRALAFVRPCLDSWIGYHATEGLRRVSIERPPLTQEEAARVGELEAQIDELSDRLGGETDDAALARDQARLRELEASIDAIFDKPPVVPDEFKGRIGTFLLIDEQGQPRLASTYFVEDEEDGEDEPCAPAEDRGASVQAAAPNVRSSKLPRRLVDELAIQRRDILSVHVAADPALALDLVIFLMADPGGRHSEGGCGFSLISSAPSDPVVGFKTPGARARIAREEASDALDRSWTGHSARSDRFDAFRALPENSRAAWLGHAVARTLEASANAGERAYAFHDHLGRLLGIDVARWWRPTGANYFDRVPKKMMLEALAEIGGPELAGRYSKAKKPELSQACERIFSGDAIAEPEVKQAALDWVPEAMRFANRAEPAEAEEPAQAGDSADSLDPAHVDSARAPQPVDVSGGPAEPDKEREPAAAGDRAVSPTADNEELEEAA